MLQITAVKVIRSLSLFVCHLAEVQLHKLRNHAICHFRFNMAVKINTKTVAALFRSKLRLVATISAKENLHLPITASTLASLLQMKIINKTKLLFPLSIRYLKFRETVINYNTNFLNCIVLQY